MEFIMSNFIKVHPMALLNHRTLGDEQLTSKIAQIISGYSSEEEFVVNRLAQGFATIASSVYPHPCIIRTSDFKSNEYASLLGGKHYEPNEENPMIGFRGASRYYAPEFQPAFELECKALHRAITVLGLDNIHVMIPFVRTPNEFQKVLAIMRDMGLDKTKAGFEKFKIGIMCEIPSNVILAEEFCKYADFFSIGSNDLTQLTLGLDRDSELIAHLFDERNPAVKTMIKNVIETCKLNNTKIGICGDGPSSHFDFAEFLIKCGIDSMSITPDAIIPLIKHLSN
jgi:pyruvate,water dikinase